MAEPHLPPPLGAAVAAGGGDGGDGGGGAGSAASTATVSPHAPTTPMTPLPHGRPVFVHCYNPACKPQAQCRKPAHDFGAEFGGARLRMGKPKPACGACRSSFVDTAHSVCYTCTEKGVPPPHQMVIARLVCAECKQSKCRALKDFVLNKEEDECPICCEDLDEGSIKAEFAPCGHACCPECFLQNVARKIQSRELAERGDTGECVRWAAGAINRALALGVKRYTVGCFTPGCASLLQTNHCISLLPQRTRDMFVRFATEAVVKGELHGEICPFPDCNDAIIELPDEESAGVVTCLSCERRFCRCCKGESLTGKCPKLEDKEEARMLAASGITPCPNCRVNIFRSKGCNRVFCTSCKKNFCWLCLELTGNENKPRLLKYAHWTDPFRPKRCRLWGGERKAQGEEREEGEGGGGAKPAPGKKGDPRVR